MTDQLTDEALAKRAEEIAKTVLPADEYSLPDAFPNGWYSEGQSNRMNSYKFATIDALKVHRDGLKVLEGLPHGSACSWWRTTNGVAGLCSCGRDKHIASLKQLLGVSQ